MPDPEPPPVAHDEGGTYATDDMLEPAERSHFRRDQNYLHTPAGLAEGEEERANAPGSQVDSGTS